MRDYINIIVIDDESLIRKSIAFEFMHNKQTITEELNNLEVLSEGTIPLDTEDYLIYKLEKECHVTKSVPANDFTRKYQEEELKKIKESLS